MKKYLIITAMMMLSGCSVFSNWTWSSLNPWNEDTQSKEVVEVKEKEVSLPSNVNKYLWDASVDELSFMGIENKNPTDGKITTKWKSMVANEKFKIVAEISDGELRGDVLDVKVYKEVKSNNNWVKVAPTKGFEAEVEQKIVDRAKILYIQDGDK